MAFFHLWRQALREGETALHYLGARRETDRARRAVAGYSLGSYLALALVPGASLRAVVVAAGGDLPSGPMSALARGVIDPLALVRRLNGTPLLMVHGRADRTVSAAGGAALRRRRRSEGDPLVECGAPAAGRGDRGRGGVAGGTARGGCAGSVVSGRSTANKAISQICS